MENSSWMVEFWSSPDNTQRVVVSGDTIKDALGSFNYNYPGRVEDIISICNYDK